MLDIRWNNLWQDDEWHYLNLVKGNDHLGGSKYYALAYCKYQVKSVDGVGVPEFIHTYGFQVFDNIEGDLIYQKEDIASAQECLEDAEKVANQDLLGWFMERANIAPNGHFSGEVPDVFIGEEK